MALRDKWLRFADEYLIDLDAAAAYRRAGYKPANDRAAISAASRLLTNVDVAAYIAEAQRQRSVRTMTEADKVVRELARLAFADMRHLLQWGPDGVSLQDSATISDDAAACVSEVSQTVTLHGGSIKIKVHSKSSALELLGKHHGLFKEKTPLDVLLAALPPDLANAVRGELARLISAGAGQAGSANQSAPGLPGPG